MAKSKSKEDRKLVTSFSLSSETFTGIEELANDRRCSKSKVIDYLYSHYIGNSDTKDICQQDKEDASVKTIVDSKNTSEFIKFYLSRLTKEIDRCKEDIKRFQWEIEELEAEKEMLLKSTEED